MTSHNQKQNRREFITQSAWIAVAVTMPCFLRCGNDKNVNPTRNTCKTTDDILGPFYKAGAPFRENIIADEDQGAPLWIEGKVFTDCNTILKDAVVEIWNANSNGQYDTSNDYKFRGQYKTDNDGRYRFKTIIPGRYLNGSTYRPSHIHFRITAPGHQELVSQIYFKNDPFISSDPWASSSKASERILTVGKDANGIDTVNFNIYLNPIK
jgi:catechol 1,2-dioxygenase